MNFTHFQDMLDAWNSPPLRHAMMGHLPIVLTLLGLPLILLSALLPKNLTARWLALIVYAALAVLAWLTVDSGQNAEAAITGALAPPAQAVLAEHEDMADRLWLFGLGTLALLALSAMRKPLIRGLAATGAALLGAAAIAWVSVTAHLGGTLVYTHGVGAGSAGGSVAVTAAPPTDGSERPSAPTGEIASGAPPLNDAPAGEPEPPTAQPDAQLAFFRAEIAPILSSRCLNCHNPTRARRSGRLDQSSRDALIAGGRSGPAIVPGDPAASLLIHRVRGDDLERDPMPPPPRDPLTPEQIAALEQWIRDGAAWDAEAITPPERPQPPGPPSQP